MRGLDSSLFVGLLDGELVLILFPLERLGPTLTLCGRALILLGLATALVLLLLGEPLAAAARCTLGRSTRRASAPHAGLGSATRLPTATVATW